MRYKGCSSLNLIVMVRKALGGRLNEIERTEKYELADARHGCILDWPVTIDTRRTAEIGIVFSAYS